MRTLKQHIDSVKSALPPAFAGSTDKLNDIINATNISANSIAGSFAIGQLSKKITVSPGDSLPANLAGISMVRDASDGSRMYERGEGAVGSDEEIGRYYIELEHVPFSSVALPFKSTGSITAGGKKLTCSNLVLLETGTYLYVRQIGTTVYTVKTDADGKALVDANGALVLQALPSTGFDPQLPGVRFYNSGLTNNSEVVYYGENEALAYWNDATLGWVVTLIADVGKSAPDGYFTIEEGGGEGSGEWDGLFISMNIIEDLERETGDSASSDAFSDFVVCVTNSTYGDYYYNITSVNEDNTFNLSGTHPYEESGSVVTIFREATSVIKFVNYSEAEITSGTYDVYYWTYPNPLTLDSDIIPFAYPDYLELMTIRRIPATKERRPVSKTELDDAMKTAKAREPKQKPPVRPKTLQGSPFSMGTVPDDAYLVRGS